jgi:hypothetical protein
MFSALFTSSPRQNGVVAPMRILSSISPFAVFGLMQHARLQMITLLACVFFTADRPLFAQPSGDTIYDLSVVDKAPEPKRRIKPSYPSSLKRRDTPAEITLRFIVTTDGKVVEINVVKFNDPDMVEPVYAAYENAKFSPGERDGKPVNTRMEVTEIFPEPKPPKKAK